jgi:hypothetical protein
MRYIFLHLYEGTSLNILEKGLFCSSTLIRSPDNSEELLLWRDNEAGFFPMWMALLALLETAGKWQTYCYDYYV